MVLSPVAELQLPPPSTPVSTGRKIRVCHLSVGLTTGGLERLLVDFARFYDQKHFELIFVALQSTGRPAEEIRAAGCEVIRLDHAKTRRQKIAALSQLFRSRGVEIVHTHNAAPHVWGTIAARLAGVPVVLQTRHGQRFGQSTFARWQYRVLGWFTDAVVSVSEDAAGLTVAQDRLAERKVRRIWNGIDVDRFAYHGPAARPVAISVARLSAEKDFPTLLKAFAIASPQVPELRLQIVGNGPERETLEALSRELQLQDRVEFLGERSDVPELLQQAAFFVTSSLTEGVSLTLLEAMAVGLPVLATAVGGNPEVVADGVTGHLVPAADPVALAAGLVRCTQELQHGPELGRRGRARVEQHFHAAGMLRQYEQLYRELLSARR